MKKILLTTAIASSVMFGGNIEPFVGMDIASIKAKPELKRTTGSTTSFYEKYNYKDTTVGLKAGAVVDNIHRVYLSYIKTSDNLDGEKSGYCLPAANYDYLILNDKLNGFVPYIGAHMGYGKTKFASYLKDKSSIDYGLNIGVLKDITQNVSLELGYKYTYINNESSSHTYVPGSISTGKINNFQTFSFGINYKF